jgi:hypothetical protein
MRFTSRLVLTLLVALTCVPLLSAGEGKHRERAGKDADKDEKLDRGELKSAVEAELRTVDTDKDGKADHGEWHKSLKTLKASLDADGDGKIDHGELKKLKEKHPFGYQRLMRRIKEHRENKDGQGAASSKESQREGYVDRRENHQEKRIEHGIEKGYLTPDETSKLQGMEKKIADTEASFKSDGKLSKDETKQLRDLLDQASVQIWAEKHDTEGKQMPTYRLGRNVFAKDDFTSKLENDNLTGAEARALMKEFREAATAKRRLSNDDLSADGRAKLQSVYNDFLNKHFEVR